MAKRTMHISTKRLLIDKANTTIVIAVGVAAAVLAFSLVTTRSLLVKRSYQSRVISAQEQARDQLEENLDAVDRLAASYSEFVGRPENIIGGNSQGNGDQDGDNAKIVLDALPGKYDYPALIASVEKILVDRNYVVQSITGTDQPPGAADFASAGGDSFSGSSSSSSSASAGVDSASEDGAETAAPTDETLPSDVVAEMPFEMTAIGQYTQMVDLLKVFQRSIRPISLQNVTFSATSNREGPSQVEMTLEAQSYFQPEKSLDIKYEVVK